MPASPPLLQLIAIALAAHVALGGARITTSLYALSLHASELTVGLLIALFALLPMLLAVPMGRLIDRSGLRRPLLFGCAAVALGCVLPAAIPGLNVLYLAVPLIGAGFMVVHVGSQHAVGVLSNPGNRAGNFSKLAVGFSMSSFTGPVLAGFIIDHVSFTAAYAACCGFALLALAVVKRSAVAETKLVVHGGQQRTGGMLELLRNPELRRIYLVGILLAAAWDLFVFMIPIRGTRLGLSASAIGLILGIFSFATFLVRLAMPAIARRHNEWQVLTGALLLTVLSYLLLPFMQQPFTLMAVAALLGLALGSAQPNVLALLHHAAPAGRSGEAIGIRVTVGNASQVLVPLAFGAAGTAIGLFAVFWTIGALVSTGIPLAWRKAFPRMEE